jgi:hypothetical protein
VYHLGLDGGGLSSTRNRSCSCSTSSNCIARTQPQSHRHLPRRNSARRTQQQQHQRRRPHNRGGGPALPRPAHAMSAPEDQTGLMWSDPAWPWRPLNRSTALQYFEHSPFYDPNSNNAAARAQNLDPSNEAVLRCARCCVCRGGGEGLVRRSTPQSQRNRPADRCLQEAARRVSSFLAALTTRATARQQPSPPGHASGQPGPNTHRTAHASRLSFPCHPPNASLPQSPAPRPA